MRSSTEYWHKAKIDDCSVRVFDRALAIVFCCAFFYFALCTSSPHMKCVYYIQVASASHAEVSVHKLKWFKNVNKCVRRRSHGFDALHERQTLWKLIAALVLIVILNIVISYHRRSRCYEHWNGYWMHHERDGILHMCYTTEMQIGKKRHGNCACSKANLAAAQQILVLHV